MKDCWQGLHHLLIFKGRLCLKQFIDGGRETIDIDLLIKKVTAGAVAIEQVFKDILSNELNDSFKFSLIETPGKRPVYAIPK